LTQWQWQSAHKIAALLTPESQILPTHGAGSFCSTTEVGGQRTTTLATEQIVNPALASIDFAAFRAAHLAYAAPVPDYYRHMAPINRSGARLYGEPPIPEPMTADALGVLNQNDVFAIDVRRRNEYAQGHVPGSILIEESGSMLAYFGWLVPFDAVLALVVRDKQQAERVTVDLFRIGYEHVRGYAPFREWAAGPRQVDTMDVLGAEDVAAALESGFPRVLDVRFAYEQVAQPLAGAEQRPVDGIQEWAASLPKGSAVAVCESGERAAMAASFLGARGYEVQCLIDGGAADIPPISRAPSARGDGIPTPHVRREAASPHSFSDRRPS
jgi:rhodanese-related sulfurtransferase